MNPIRNLTRNKRVKNKILKNQLVYYYGEKK